MNTENIINDLKPLDYVIEEKTITLLFNDNKILILNDFDDKIMFSFFIDRKLGWKQPFFHTHDEN